MSSAGGELITETFGCDGGRQVTAYLPSAPPQAVVVAGDGQLTAPWGECVADAGAPPTMIVGVHRPADETLRLHEYAPGFDPQRFAADEAFFVDDVRRWVRSRFGVSAGAELALAIGLRHPAVYGAVFCASPGAGYRPPDVMPAPPPRAYFVAGTQEPFFRDNAIRWADALRGAGADVVMTERHEPTAATSGEPSFPSWRPGRSGDKAAGLPRRYRSRRSLPPLGEVRPPRRRGPGGGLAWRGLSGGGPLRRFAVPLPQRGRRGGRLALSPGSG